MFDLVRKPTEILRASGPALVMSIHRHQARHLNPGYDVLQEQGGHALSAVSLGLLLALPVA